MLTAEIAHLNACAGGLGVTSAADSVSHAYAASLFLTMPIIAAVLPDDSTSADMTALFPEVAAILADPERPAKLGGITLDSLRTAGVSRV